MEDAFLVTHAKHLLLKLPNCIVVGSHRQNHGKLRSSSFLKLIEKKLQGAQGKKGAREEERQLRVAQTLDFWPSTDSNSLM